MGIEGQRILNLLDFHHDGKVGYVIYRVTYGDDEKWAQFMERLSSYVKANLNESDGEDGRELIRDCWAWDIRDDQKSFDGASKLDICRHFNDWVKSINEDTEITKYSCCIYADAEVLDSMLSAYIPDSTRPSYVDGPEPYVKLIHHKMAEEHDPCPEKPSIDNEEEDDAIDEDCDDDPYDDDEDWESGEGKPIDGCECWDVGWQKMSVDNLLPRAYALFLDSGWKDFYRRPQVVNCG